MAGDTTASAIDRLEQAYLANRDRLVTFAAALVGEKGLAEDVVHDVFAVLASRPEHFASIESPAAYLTVCARNSAVALLRRRKKDTASADRIAETMSSGVGDPSEQASRLEENGTLVRLLSALPDEMKEALALRIWGEMGFEEIAKVQGVSRSTAYTRYMRALERLHRVLARGAR